MDLLRAGLTPLEGGFSGETFLAEAAGERSVVRIYADRGARRGSNAVEVDAAVLRLVRGLLPVPEVLEVRRPDESARTPGLLVMSYLEGNRLDLVLRDASPELRGRVAASAGEMLARLAQMPMLRPGMFLDGDLKIGAFPPGAEDLVEWVTRHSQQRVLREWSTSQRAGLLEVADRAQRLLDGVDRACLVHSDFNPKNLLVDPWTGVVTGLVDWEFAHSGGPFTDLGNFLRFEREPLFAEEVLATYVRGTSGLDPSTSSGRRKRGQRDEVLDRARASDLWALVDLAARSGDHPVASRAHDHLLAIARTGDLHATAV